MSLADERRAIGAAMEVERRGSTLVDDLRRLQQPPRKRKALPTIDPKGALAARRGRADFVPQPTTATGGGIASPLTEQSVEWWPGGLVTSDGLFVIPARKSWTFTDANGAEVVFEFQEPVAP